MGPVDYIILAVIVAVLAGAVWFIWRSKKKGQKCIGCPSGCACSSGNCSGGCNGCCEKH